MEHVWSKGQVKNFSTNRSAGNKRQRSNRRKISATRPGFICTCGLVALAPSGRDGAFDPNVAVPRKAHSD
jgi:hypothetical protein